MKSNKFIQTLISTLYIFVGDKLGILGPSLLLFIFLMIVDYISGMLASKSEAIKHPNNPKYGWSSKKSVIGIYKKIGYMVTILVAICTDYIIYTILQEIGVPHNTRTVFGLLVTTWFILNEMLSILENAKRMGVRLPQFIVKALADIKDDIDKNQ
ncbi:MAG: holin family protein [Acetatifactor sp.]